MEPAPISPLEARIERPLDYAQLGYGVLESIEFAEKRLGADPFSPDYEPVYDQN